MIEQFDDPQTVARTQADCLMPGRYLFGVRQFDSIPALSR